MIAAGLLASLLAAASASHKPKPPPPPQPVTLPPLADQPFVSNPSFTPDDKNVLVSRFGAPQGAAGHEGKLYLVPLAHPGDAAAIDVAGANDHNAFRAHLSPDGRRIAYLADGELWLRGVPGAAADEQQPARLYPPDHGDAPLGPRLSHAVWAWDGSWLLLESPLGWARLIGKTGALETLPLKPSDLEGGSLILGPDGVHAAFVRPSTGVGWINGAKVVVINLQTGQAQIVDPEHDYTELAALPDGQLLGKDAVGNLWILRGRRRTLYLQPPAVAGATAGQYVVSLDGSTIAYVSTGASGSQLFVGKAPPIPPWPKKGEVDPH